MARGKPYGVAQTCAPKRASASPRGQEGPNREWGLNTAQQPWPVSASFSTHDNAPLHSCPPLAHPQHGPALAELIWSLTGTADRCSGPHEPAATCASPVTKSVAQMRLIAHLQQHCFGRRAQSQVRIAPAIY